MGFQQRCACQDSPSFRQTGIADYLVQANICLPVLATRVFAADHWHVRGQFARVEVGVARRPGFLVADEGLVLAVSGFVSAKFRADREPLEDEEPAELQLNPGGLGHEGRGD